MKRISNSDLLEGLTCPYEDVKEAYLVFALQKWLTSKNYGPKDWTQVKELQEFLPSNLCKYLQSKIEDFLPKVITKTKGLDFSKVDCLLQSELHLGQDFLFAIAYATLINLDLYPNAGINRLPKKAMIKKLQNKLSEIEDMAAWGALFSLGRLSPSGLEAFSSWAQNQEKESLLDVPVIWILCEQAKTQARFAKQIFEISLYLIKNFKGFLNEAVECLDDFCSCYPMFRKPLENFLLKNFDRYFWRLEPFPYRNPLQYYKEMMEHLTSRKLHFSITWKMKIVQKMLNQAEDRAIIIYLLDHLKVIYGSQIDDVDEAYFKAIKTGLKKKNISGDDVSDIVNTMASGPIFGREHWWKNFAQYPLAWQKTMVMVYSSEKLSRCLLARAYFSIVRMNQENSELFADFEQLASCMLTKEWNISNQDILSFFEVFRWSSYSESTFSYMKRGLCKLLQIAGDLQIEELKGLKKMLPQYAKILEMPELKAKFAEIAEKQMQQQKAEAERKKEIAFLLAKLQ